MSAIINHSYFDFFTIAVDAFKSQDKSIYRKLMTTIINSYKSLIDELELSSAYLDNHATLDQLHTQLEDFYDNIYDSIEIIKLYKQQLQELKNQDELFDDLHQVTNKLHLAMVEYLDRISTLEVKNIQQKYAKRL
ncbi:MAG: hypothetical protein KU38_11655 [Sulfurovum sp. FS08-3]|nr:MAG: hypothetical protein KU38_11655 [Sulfurovum sp. FS08-3]